MSKDEGATRADAVGGRPRSDHEEAPEPSADSPQAEQPALAGKRPLQEAIDESIGSAAGGPGA